MKGFKLPPQGWLTVHLNDKGLEWYCERPGRPALRGSGVAELPDVRRLTTVVLLPTAQVTLAPITLSHAREEALCWQMEPLLTQEMVQMHVVRLARHGDEHLMAATDAAGFARTLLSLQQQGIRPQRVIPDCLAIPPGHRLKLERHWLVRSAEGSGLALQEDELPLLPALAQLPELPGDPLPLLGQGARQSKACLLQGAFRVQRSLRLPLLCLGLAIGLLALSSLAPPLWQGWQAKQQQQALERQLQARFLHYFPGEPPSQPLRQLVRRAAQQPANHAPLTGLLHQAAPLLERLKNNPLQSLEWNGQQLQLRFRHPLTLPLRPDAPAELQVQVDGSQLTLSRTP